MKKSSKFSVMICIMVHPIKHNIYTQAVVATPTSPTPGSLEVQLAGGKTLDELYTNYYNSIIADFNRSTWDEVDIYRLFASLSILYKIEKYKEKHE